MAEVDRLIEKLRTAWHTATEKNKPQDALKALIELERIQPSEPAWSQRLGEAYRRTNHRKESVDAFARAWEGYLKRGFLPRAIAMAKLVGTMDPARGAALESLLPGASAPIMPSLSPPPGANAPLQLGQLGRLGAGHSLPPLKPIVPAPLTPAPDQTADEVRFSDANESSISVLLTDFSILEQAPPPPPQEPSIESVPSAAPVESREVTDFDVYATMATFRLFASLSRDALVALANASELVEFVPSAKVIVKNEKAFALYAIVSGSALVIVKDVREIRLGEGDIFGESSLLDEGQRQADVQAETQMMTLRIEKAKLETVTKGFPEVENALFDLLARRLVTNLMYTSGLFAAFDPPGKLELAQCFEVRRAAAGTVVMERDRRADGLYILLAGTVMADTGDGPATRVARGAAFGHSGLMGGKSEVTVTATTEAVLLRMPASQFATLAAHYPPVLAYLAETANEPIPMSVRG